MDLCSKEVQCPVHKLTSVVKTLMPLEMKKKSSRILHIICGKIILNNSTDNLSLESFVNRLDFTNFFNSSNNTALVVLISSAVPAVPKTITGTHMCFNKSNSLPRLQF